MNHENLPSDPAVAREVITAQSAASQAKVDRGFIGVIFGTKDNAPNNVAGFVVILCLISIVYLAVTNDSSSHNDKSISYLLPILTSFGGFMFGRGSKG